MKPRKFSRKHVHAIALCGVNMGQLVAPRVFRQLRRAGCIIGQRQVHYRSTDGKRNVYAPGDLVVTEKGARLLERVQVAGVHGMRRRGPAHAGQDDHVDVVPVTTTEPAP